VIIRLMGEGQYEVDHALLEELNVIDAAAAAALEAGNEPALHEHLEALTLLVRRSGQRLEPTRLCESDLIVPPADLSLAEGRELFSAAGLIPDLPVY
jgi:hypothetical protein